MFKNNKLINYENYIDVNKIYQNQKDIFFTFTGYDPVIGKRYKSPFRYDTDAGCRFEYKGNKLYFVDNAGYNGKIFFDCIDTVTTLYPYLDFIDILNLIKNKVGLKDFKTPLKQEFKYLFKPQIKFKYVKWNKDNYFTKKYNIHYDYLNNQPYYNVKDYWTNSKLDRSMKPNKYGFPCIAYYFDESDNTKLYFPENGKNKTKWYSTCNNNDIFGWHRLDYYLNKGGDIYLLSGGKDELCLNYEFDLNTFAFQTETFPKDINKLDNYIPVKFKDILPHFNRLFVWLDNDEKGIESSKIISSYFNNYIDTRIISQDYFNDVADIYENNKNLLKLILNEY